FAHRETDLVGVRAVRPLLRHLRARSEAAQCDNPASPFPHEAPLRLEQEGHQYALHGLVGRGLGSSRPEWAKLRWSTEVRQLAPHSQTRSLRFLRSSRSTDELEQFNCFQIFLATNV